jgi:acyl-protein synthetase LuxE
MGRNKSGPGKTNWDIKTRPLQGFRKEKAMTNSTNPITLTHRELIRQSQAWAFKGRFNPERACALRRQANLANHAHYLENIPAYRKYAQEEGIAHLDDLAPIKRQLMFPDDIFKSYDQRWLDEKNFTRMNAWLSEIHHRRVDVDVTDIDSIDAWIDRLAEAGIKIIYSSGTSGSFSFIPRDAANMELFRAASRSYLAPLLMPKILATPLQQFIVKLAYQWLSTETMLNAGRRTGGMGLSNFDAVFLDFNRGHTGNQTLEQELAHLFNRSSFLYETQLSPTVLRLATRGPRTDEDRAQLLALQDMVIGQKEQNYIKIIEQLKQSTADGQKVFIFGTPYQLKELCGTIATRNGNVRLKEGSLVLFGGGWKSFSGEMIPREQLITLMNETLDLPPEQILEGYSMTEINVFMLRCEHGRFHIPPLIEPVIYNEELEMIEGDNLRGTLGFLDPFATSYPGFIISGDEVHFVNGDCACGLIGPAVTEIGRSQHREVKGCGGIMASLAA